jgi:PQQ enzyme-like repeat protein
MRPLGRVFLVLLGAFVLFWVGLGVALVHNSFFAAKPLPPLVTCSGPDGGKGEAPGVDDHASGHPTLERALGDPASSGLSKWPGLFDAAPKAYDFDGDGTDELVAQSNDTHVYVFSATTGRVLATFPTTCPGGWYIERVLNGVEAGVMHPGEPASVVVTDPAAFVTVWQFDPAASNPDHFTFHQSWERRVDECFWNPGMDAKPTLADVDGDGVLEILVQTEEQGFFALNADGATRWKQCWAGGNSEPLAEDLDGDGKLEAIVASDSGFISVLNAATGDPLWTFDAADPVYGIRPASVSVSPTVAELDGRAPREILFTARYAPADDATLFPTFHMAIFAVHQNTTTWQPELLWMRQPEWAHPLSYTHLVVDDVDGDGSADIFGMDWNTIGHLPGHWEPMGAAHVFRLTSRGEDVWMRPVESWWSNKDIELGDADHDGQPDLLVDGVQNEGDGLWRLSAFTGEPQDFWYARPWKLMRGPSLLDLHHDGVPELVYAAAPDALGSQRGALLVSQLAPTN